MTRSPVELMFCESSQTYSKSNKQGRSVVDCSSLPLPGMSCLGMRAFPQWHTQAGPLTISLLPKFVAKFDKVWGQNMDRLKKDRKWENGDCKGEKLLIASSGPGEV